MKKLQSKNICRSVEKTISEKKTYGFGDGIESSLTVPGGFGISFCGYPACARACDAAEAFVLSNVGVATFAGAEPSPKCFLFLGAANEKEQWSRKK